MRRIKGDVDGVRPCHHGYMVWNADKNIYQYVVYGDYSVMKSTIEEGACPSNRGLALVLRKGKLEWL